MFLHHCGIGIIDHENLMIQNKKSQRNLCSQKKINQSLKENSLICVHCGNIHTDGHVICANIYTNNYKFKCNSICLLGFYCCADFHKIWHGNSLILDKGHRLLFTPITDTHVGGAAGNGY